MTTNLPTAPGEGGLSSVPTPAPTPVPSPCINVCRMHAQSGLCEGCLRTLDEIAAWSQFSEAAKAAVWQALAVRRTEAGSATPGSSSP